MHSLRWFCDKVARASPPPARDAKQADDQTPEPQENNGDCQANRDVANDLHRLDGEARSRDQPWSSDDCNENSKTARTKPPTTPTTKQPSRIPKWTGDSGYGSASSFGQRRHHSTEDLHAPPTKIDQRRSPAFSGEQRIPPDLEFSLRFDDAHQEQESGRDRHDSVLSSHISRVVESKKAGQNDDHGVKKSLSPFSTSDHVDYRLLPDDGFLPEHSNVRCVQKPRIAPSICDSGNSQGRSSASGEFAASSEAQSIPITCREELNRKFEIPVNGSSPFWRVSDGVDEPKILQQVPCLQCVLKRLHCDQKLPQCSRCVRSAHGPCLVQRDLLAEERWKAGLWGNNGGASYSVLVRLKSDGEETWTVKKAMEASMLTYLAEQHDRRNWVAPKSDGDLGSYKKLLHATKPKYLLDYARGHIS